MKRVFLFLIYLFCLLPQNILSQKRNDVIKNINSIPESRLNTDSLIKLLPNIKDSALQTIIFNKILAISHNIKYPIGEILAYDQMGVMCRNLSKYSDALRLHKKALELAKHENNINLQVQVLNNIGVVYRRIDDSKQALDYHIAALRLAEDLNDLRNICISTNSIGNIYITMGKDSDALINFKRALILEQKRDNTLGIAINLNNIGSVFNKQALYDSALIYYNASLQCNYKLQNMAGQAICYNSIGEIYIKKKEIDKAILFFEKSLKMNLQIGDEIYTSESYSNIAIAYLQKNNTEIAIEYFNKALFIALKIGSKTQAQIAYKGLSDCYAKSGNYEKSLQYYKSSVAYSDSILNEENFNHIAKIQAQYDSEKKQQQIIILEKEKKASSLINFLMLFLIVGIILIGTFIYLNSRQKRLISKQEIYLKEQRIRELEKEQQLLATQSVLQGEETERRRLARDLHDGLGGILSGIKLTFLNFKGKFEENIDDKKQFGTTLTLIDSSIKELRRVAHNMMPEALVKFGVKDALSDFCKDLNNSNLHVIFNFYGDEKRIENKYETNLYRIAQELINNSIKHSQASQLIVQLIQENNRLNLTVQDNGKGFDTNLIKTTKSSGLANTKSRVESLGGWIEIYSQLGLGTEIAVEFKIVV